VGEQTGGADRKSDGEPRVKNRGVGREYGDDYLSRVNSFGRGVRLADSVVASTAFARSEALTTAVRVNLEAPALAMCLFKPRVNPLNGRRLLEYELSAVVSNIGSPRGSSFTSPDAASQCAADEGGCFRTGFLTMVVPVPWRAYGRRGTPSSPKGKGCDDGCVVRLRIDSVRREGHRLVVQGLIMDLGALVMSEQGPRHEHMVKHVALPAMV